MTGIVTVCWISLIFFTGDIRATPPSLRMSAGTRSSAMTETAPASSAIFACSALVTSMMTPPLSISARPMCFRSAIRSPFRSDMWSLLILSLYDRNRRALHPFPAPEPGARGFDRFGEPPDALFDPPGGHRREREPERALAAAVHEEGRAGREGDAPLDGLRQERPRVHARRQRDKQRESPSGLRPGHLGRHASPQGCQQERATPSVHRRDAGCVTVEELALAEAVHRRLDKGARVEIGELLGRLEPLEDRPRTDEPAEPQARKEDLRERADIDHDTATVGRLDRQARPVTVVEAAVEPVLDDRHLVARPGLQPAPPGLRRDGQSRRIVGARLTVEELRRVALQQALEDLSPRSRAVPGHAEKLGPERSEHLHGPRVCRLLDRNEVARIDQRAGDQVEPLLRAVHDL